MRSRWSRAATWPWHVADFTVQPGLFWPPGLARRRAWMVNFSLLVAALYLCVGWCTTPRVWPGGVHCGAGHSVLQYSDVRRRTRPTRPARAVGVHHGHVSGVQSLTGRSPTGRRAWAGALPRRMATIAALLALGSIAFRCRHRRCCNTPACRARFGIKCTPALMNKASTAILLIAINHPQLERAGAGAIAPVQPGTSSSRRPAGAAKRRAPSARGPWRERCGHCAWSGLHARVALPAVERVAA